MTGHYRFGQFDGEKGQYEAHHRHCGNQISRDVEGVGGGGGRDRSRPHHDHDTCARHEPGRRRRTAVTVQNMTAITKTVDNALNR